MPYSLFRLIFMFTYASIGLDDLFDVLKLVPKVLSLSQREAVVVERAHLLSESTASVVERGHASDVGGASLEGAVSMAGEEAGWRGSHAVVRWLALVALSSH